MLEEYTVNRQKAIEYALSLEQATFNAQAEVDAQKNKAEPGGGRIESVRHDSDDRKALGGDREDDSSMPFHTTDSRGVWKGVWKGVFAL